MLPSKDHPAVASDRPEVDHPELLPLPVEPPILPWDSHAEFEATDEGWAYMNLIMPVAIGLQVLEFYQRLTAMPEPESGTQH